MYLNDLADVCLFVLENWFPCKNEIQFLNAGTGTDTTIEEIEEHISFQSNFSGEIQWDSSKRDGSQRKPLNVNRINQLGWRAKISMT